MGWRLGVPMCKIKTDRWGSKGQWVGHRLPGSWSSRPLVVPVGFGVSFGLVAPWCRLEGFTVLRAPCTGREAWAWLWEAFSPFGLERAG